MVGGTHAPCGWFLLRAAMLPAGTLSEWEAGLEAPDAVEPGELRAALERDRVRLRARLARLLERPDIHRALELASSSLITSLGDGDIPEGRRGRRVERTLVAYLSRFCSRPAPFGLFAGVGVGRLADVTELQIAPDSQHSVWHGLDVAFAARLAEAMASDPELADEVRFVPAPTLIPAVAGRIRVIRPKADAGEERHEIATFKLTPALARLLQIDPGGATVPELIDALGPRSADARRRARAFVERAIERGLLVCTLDPPVTGLDPLEHLCREVAALPSGAARATQLGDLQVALERMRRLDEALRPARVQAVRSAAAALPVLPAGDAELLRTVRTFPGETLTLGPELTATIVDAANLLLRVGGTGWPDVLGALRERFSERFGLREVPLVEMFDDEVGLGVSDFDALDARPPSGQEAREAHLLNLVLAAAAEQRHEVNLSDRDLELLGSANPISATTASVFVSIAASTPAAAAAGDLDVLAHALGLEGPRLFARFADALPNLESRLRELVRVEQRHAPDALVADVILRHGTRLGNVVERPRLHEWEIELIGRSGAPPERRIPVQDLLVSVREDRFRVRSRMHGAAVEPRQCSALIMDRRRPALARFLWMVGQGGSGPAWTWAWGKLNRASWLPRVRRGRVLLALERWIVTAEEAAALASAPDPVGRHTALRAWRERRRIPRKVDLVELDRWVRLDLENVLSVDMLVARLAAGRGGELREAWPPDGMQSAVVGSAGGVANELLVPLHRVRALARPNAPGPTDAISLAQRRRPPGSEWLYLKLYGQPATLERALAMSLAGACRELVGSGVAERWFARLGGDPDPHLGVRVCGDPARLLPEGLAQLEGSVEEQLADGRIRRITLDTYERDVERYAGLDGLAGAEVVFQADSELLARLLADGDIDPERRYWLALSGVAWLINAVLEDDPAAQTRQLRERRDALLTQAGTDITTARLFAGHARSDPTTAEGWLGGTSQSARETAALNDWRAAAGVAVARLRALGVPLPDLAASLAQAHARLVLAPGEPADAELQLYDALLRVSARRAALGRVSPPAARTEA